MQKYLLRKADGSERFIFVGEEKVDPKPKSKKVPLRAKNWEYAVHLSRPERKTLTKRQYEERSELLRICKFHGLQDSYAYECMSLQDLRDWKANRIAKQIKNLTV